MAKKREEYAMSFGLAGMLIGFPIGYVIGLYVDGLYGERDTPFVGFCTILGAAIFMVVFGFAGWQFGKRKENGIVDTEEKEE